MSKQDANQLLRDAEAALAVGDKQQGTALLKQAVATNPDLLEAWQVLASVLENKDEKRAALTTILRLDPRNEAAQADLLATETLAATGASEDEIVPGITRREARRVGIGLTVFTIVVFGLVLLITSTINGQRAATARQVAQANADNTATEAALLANATAAAAELTAEVTNAAATLFAQSSPTPTATPTRNRADLPTPIPPTATPTTVSLRVLSEAPNFLIGRIFAWGGSNPSSDEFRTLRIYPAGGNGTFEEFRGELSQSPSADNAGNQVIYLKYRRQGEWGLVGLNPNDPASEAQNFRLRLADNSSIINPLSPSLSLDGSKIAFVAINPQTNRKLVYLLDVASNQLTLLTPPDADYTAVAISPDGSKIAAVSNTGAATDIVLIDAVDADNLYPRTPLTTDGNGIMEETVDFAADGTTLVFSGTANGNSDLYLLRLSGTTAAGIEKLTTATLANREIFPTFSPDGRYIAYAANPSGMSEFEPDGVMNLFIFELGVGNTYQLTAEDASVFPGSWSN
jgi:hypothetical protein